MRSAWITIAIATTTGKQKLKEESYVDGSSERRLDEEFSANGILIKISTLLSFNAIQCQRHLRYKMLTTPFSQRSPIDSACLRNVGHTRGSLHSSWTACWSISIKIDVT